MIRVDWMLVLVLVIALPNRAAASLANHPISGQPQQVASFLLTGGGVLVQAV